MKGWVGAWKGKGLVQSTAAPKGVVKTAGLLLKEEAARFVCISPPMLSGGKTFCFFASAHGTYCASKREESFWQRASVYFPLSLKVLNV